MWANAACSVRPNGLACRFDRTGSAGVAKAVLCSVLFLGWCLVALGSKVIAGVTGGMTGRDTQLLRRSQPSRRSLNPRFTWERLGRQQLWRHPRRSATALVNRRPESSKYAGLSSKYSERPAYLVTISSPACLHMRVFDAGKTGLLNNRALVRCSRSLRSIRNGTAFHSR